MEDHSSSRMETKWKKFDSAYKHDSYPAFADGLVEVAGTLALYNEVSPSDVKSRRR